jgi:hypothetical protein
LLNAVITSYLAAAGNPWAPISTNAAVHSPRITSPSVLPLVRIVVLWFVHWTCGEFSIHPLTWTCQTLDMRDVPAGPVT